MARITAWGMKEEDSSESESGSTSRTVVAYHSDEHAVARPRSPPERAGSFFHQYIGYSAWAVTHPVSAIEHHWAIRATRAEAMLDAHALHRHEIFTLEERRSREIAEMNARHSREFARQQWMVWILLGIALSALSSLIYTIYHHSPAAATSRWLGPLHFTIPVLSPFASVIEHETSVVNVQLVALLILAAASFAFLWLRCGVRR